MTRIFFAVVAIMFSNFASAAGKYGVEVTVPSSAIYKNITYSYDRDWTWGMAVETSPALSNAVLFQAGAKWSVIDASSGGTIVPAQQFDGSQAIFKIQLKSQISIMALLPVQKKALILITKEDGDPQYFLALGKFCAQYPEKVADLTNPAASACEVTLSNDADACRDYGDYLSKLVKKGSLPCKIAEQSYSQGSLNFPDALNCGTRKFCEQ